MPLDLFQPFEALWRSSGNNYHYSDRIATKHSIVSKAVWTSVYTKNLPNLVSATAMANRYCIHLIC